MKFTLLRSGEYDRISELGIILHMERLKIIGLGGPCIISQTGFINYRLSKKDNS